MTTSVTFESLGLPEKLVRNLRSVGYENPTPIQARAIPLILPGRDLVAAAQTGSGKTAAFLLPILVRLLTAGDRLRGLVLVPTRELAAQVEQAAQKYARHTGIRVASVYGGVPIGPQERVLRHEGVDLLIATPGRLLDLNGRQSVSLQDVEVLVLDEADRMVDMGFAPDLRRILHLLPSHRQTLMFSATMPTELNKVASEALNKPQRLEISPPSKPVESVSQAFYPVSRHLKANLLEEILQRAERGSTIVFARTKRGADRLTRILHDRGLDADVLHGDRSQGQRERTMLKFRRGRVDILVATDIASRGIDVTDVTHVINFDVPLSPEDYVHRIGRTGRMHSTGDALTLVSPEEEKDANAIERHIGHKVTRRKLSDFDYGRVAPPRGANAGGGRGGAREPREERGRVRRSASREGAPARASHARDTAAPARGRSSHAATGRSSSGESKPAGESRSGGHAKPAASHGRRPKPARDGRRR
ncbi:MAG: DEAD/DEAH box helicase [Candidatus Eisenbacteria bacterium]|uniref:DEAD/DEAH box helicase n=1 Tax=Eiseniibacteriota bacterium TaxID=2212470 RepID=A0A849SDT3_UNCEI|nr:DEAD/DEAH box helicase [Candidatus Eisenbacteria bacterium]